MFIHGGIRAGGFLHVRYSLDIIQGVFVGKFVSVKILV